MLQNEKGRHLEQNSVDKEILQSKIDSLMKDQDDIKKKMVSINNENNILKEKLSKVN